MNERNRERKVADIAHSIDLNLPEKLRDRAYRLKFFWAETSAKIAAQLIALRKRRGLNQTQVAELVGTKQPAISRAEQADYQHWNVKTLRSYAEALDARVRVLIEPSEDVIHEYEADKTPAVVDSLGALTEGSLGMVKEINDTPRTTTLKSAPGLDRAFLSMTQ